ncbi:hypothetical protein, partial [Paenibacillus aceti]
PRGGATGGQPATGGRPPADSRRRPSAAHGAEQPRVAGQERKTAEQRVFIKITAAAENAALLVKLKQLLQLHPGPLATVLFYESTGKLLALSDRYSIKPSPDLFREMEQMLGDDTVKVK